MRKNIYNAISYATQAASHIAVTAATLATHALIMKQIYPAVSAATRYAESINSLPLVLGIGFAACVYGSLGLVSTKAANEGVANHFIRKRHEHSTTRDTDGRSEPAPQADKRPAMRPGFP